MLWHSLRPHRQPTEVIRTPAPAPPLCHMLLNGRLACPQILACDSLLSTASGASSSVAHATAQVGSSSVQAASSAPAAQPAASAAPTQRMRKRSLEADLPTAVPHPGAAPQLDLSTFSPAQLAALQVQIVQAMQSQRA